MYAHMMISLMRKGKLVGGPGTQQAGRITDWGAYTSCTILCQIKLIIFRVTITIHFKHAADCWQIMKFYSN